MNKPKLMNDYRKAPIYILLIIILFVFSAEFILMILLENLKWQAFNAILLDSSLLVVLLFTALYVLVYRPLKSEIEENKRIQRELEKALDEVIKLKGIIPICAYCQQIKNAEGAWKKIEPYISEHSDAEFFHSICDECYKKQKEEIDKI